VRAWRDELAEASTLLRMWRPLLRRRLHWRRAAEARMARSEARIDALFEVMRLVAEEAGYRNCT
jgi:hypothetical protein